MKLPAPRKYHISQPKRLRLSLVQYQPTGKASHVPGTNYYKELFGQERPYRRLEQKQQQAESNSPFSAGEYAEPAGDKRYRFEEFNADRSKEYRACEFQHHKGTRVKFSRSVPAAVE